MLRHANHRPRIPKGFCCVGSSAVPGRAVVRARRVAGGGGAGPGGDDRRRQSLASGVGGERPTRPEGGGASWPKAATRRRAVADDRAGAESGPGRAWLQHGVVDAASGGRGDQAVDRRGASSRACVASAAEIRLVPPTPRPARAGAGRRGDRAVENDTLGAAKKNARRRRAWLVFEDESGVSQHPVVRRTWAPRGQTPVLIHTGGHWKRLSVAGALAFRWDGCRMRFFFQTQAGTYTDRRLITFLRSLKRHFRRQRVILIWDGLGAHQSHRMKTYIAQQRAWLTVERLPAYAPDLNPIEQVWGNVKTRELANVCAPDLATLRRPLYTGFGRVRRA